MSWKPEVQVSKDSKWYDNAVRFETEAEAKGYAEDLKLRWTSANKVRVTEANEPVNGKWVNGKMVWLDQVK